MGEVRTSGSPDRVEKRRMNMNSAEMRVARWRAEALHIRLGQAALIALLAYAATGSQWVFAWLALIMASLALDSVLFAQALKRPDSRTALVFARAAMFLSNAVFASIAMALLIRDSFVTEVGAALVLCGVGLNNTLMTRGAAVETRISIGAVSLVCLVGGPVAIIRFRYVMSVADMIVLALAAVLVFTTFLKLAKVLREEEKARQDAEARWRMLFEQSPLPQICIDASDLSAAISSTLLKDPAALVRSLLGGSATIGDLLRRVRLKEMNLAMQELAGEDLADSTALNRLFDETCLTGLTQALSHARPGDGLPAFECRLHTPSGEAREVSLRIHAVTGTRRPWETCLVTVVDVTEARRAAEAQSRALEAAETANRAKSEFLAVMSHEIRTPLNGVLGMAAALERGDLSDRQRSQIEVIGRSGQALLAILNDILDLSKIEAGKLEIELEPFRLEEVVADVRDAFSQIAAGKGLSLACEISPDVSGDYVGDAVRIRQILTNLVSNAVKFTSQGHVRVSAEALSGGVRLSVEDTGIGVAPADQERLFERFIQADSTATRRFGGTGLGLAICRELCSALGGSISLTSEPGRGSRCTVELPLTRHDPVRRAQSEDAAIESTCSGALRILAAEDNSMNQIVLRTLLQQLGIEPVIVPDGRAAVDACAAQAFDLVLMDIQMPVLDGVAATREIRRHEAAVGRAPVPIIALTANVMSHQIYEYRAAGMDACVSKPIQFAELLETIDALTAPELSRESHDLRGAG